MRGAVKLFLPALILACALAGVAENALAQDHWVATWAAAPQAPRALPRPATPAPAGVPAPAAINNQTVRMVVRTSIGGRRLRLQLSNAFGNGPLQIGAAHLALRDKDSAIVPGSDRAITFSGQSSFSIPAGADALSDPVALDVPALTDLAVSLYIPSEPPSMTMHLTALHTTYIAKETGDLTAAPALTDADTVLSWFWISGVDVAAPENAATVVAFGDSITDGTTSTPDADRSWPSRLAERLVASKPTANVALVNEGIAGNRLLNDGAGVSALARFDRDVLSQPGVKWLIVLEGINDIGLGAGPAAGPSASITADDVIAAHKQMIERAHLRGIKVVGATLTPYMGASYSSDRGDAIRVALNQWIRTSHAYDAVIDFDAAVQDPANPRQIRPSFNIRDHLHPNDDGYKAMADAIDLSIFSRKGK